MNFTEQDFKQFNEFRKFLNDKASWMLSSTEAVQLVQYFQMFHSLSTKIEANIAELRKLQNPKSPVEVVA